MSSSSDGLALTSGKSRRAQYFLTHINMSHDKNRYRLRDVYDGHIVEWSLNEILQDINRDRSEGWQDYDESNWQEGLDVFTEWELIGIEQS